MKAFNYLKKLTLIVLLMFSCKTYSQQNDRLNGVPTIVGKGSVSSRDFEFNFAVHEGSKYAFFTKALLPDWRRMSIVQSKKKADGLWEEPILASFSGKFRDADPFVTPDQSKLLFISDRPSNTQSKGSDYSIWYIDLNDTTEGPQLFTGDFYKEIPSPLYPSMSLNGTLYFSSFSDGTSTIYKSVQMEGGYGEALPLPFNKKEYFDLDPMIAPDESFIIFISNNRAGVGGQDLFVSFNNDGKWSDPFNLGDKINSRGNDSQPGISSNGKTLYFSSNRTEEVSTLKPRNERITTLELKKELESIFNGLPNIWMVDISDIENLNPKK